MRASFSETTALADRICLFRLNIVETEFRLITYYFILELET